MFEHLTNSPVPIGSRSRRTIGVAAVFGLLASMLTLTLPGMTVDAEAAGNSIVDGFNDVVYDTVTSGGIQYVGGAFTAWGPQVPGGALVDAASGVLDRSFPDFDGDVRVALADGVGGMFVGGTFDQLGGHPTSLAYITADGSIDTSFQVFLGGSVDALALSGGVLYVGGGFECVGRSQRPRGECTEVGEETARDYLAAFSSSTAQVQTWDPSPDGEVSAIAVRGDSVFVGGSFMNFGADYLPFLAEISALTGSTTDWTPAPSTNVSSLVVSDSTLYVGGYFVTMQSVDSDGMVSTETRNRLAAFNLASSITLTSWDPNANGGVVTIAVAGSTVYVGGGFTMIGGVTRNRIAALTSIGEVIPSWDPSADGFVSDIEVIGDQVYVAGSFANIGSGGGLARAGAAAVSAYSDSAVVAVLTDWNPNPDTFSLTLMSFAGKVFVGGSFSTINDWQPRSGLAAVSSDGNLTSWAPNVNNYVMDLLVLNSRLYALGNFTRINGVSRTGMAAFAIPSGALTSWNPIAAGGGGEMSAWDLEGNTIYVAGNFASMNSQDRFGLAAVDVTSGALTPWNPDAPSDGGGTYMPGSVFDLEVSGDVVYVGGSFDTFEGDDHPLIAALDSTTGAVSDWDPKLSGWNITQLAVVGSTVVFGGRVECVGTYTRGGPCDRSDLGEVALNGMGGVDVSTGVPVTGWIHDFLWSTDQTGNPRKIVTVGSTTYIAGQFQLLDGQRVGNLAAFTSSGAFIPGWRPVADGDVYGFEVDGSAATISGVFSRVNGQTPSFRQSISLYSAPAPVPDSGGGASAPSPGVTTPVVLTPVQQSPAQQSPAQQSQLQAAVNTVLNLTPSQVQLLSASQLAGLPAAAFAVMTPFQIRALDPKQIKSLTAEQIKSIPAASLRAMKPETIMKLSVSQIRAMTPAQALQLRDKQIRVLGPTKRDQIKTKRSSGR